jgi:hypothetical protein
VQFIARAPNFFREDVFALALLGIVLIVMGKAEVCQIVLISVGPFAVYMGNLSVLLVKVLLPKRAKTTASAATDKHPCFNVPLDSLTGHCGLFHCLLLSVAHRKAEISIG